MIICLGIISSLSQKENIHRGNQYLYMVYRNLDELYYKTPQS